MCGWWRRRSRDTRKALCSAICGSALLSSTRPQHHYRGGLDRAESYQILMSNDCRPKRLSVHASLRVDELGTHYRRAIDPGARSHWQVVGRLAPGLPSAHVAAVTGDAVNGIRLMVRRYHQQGPAGRDDRRHRNPGARGLLSAARRTALATALLPPPPDGGVWTGPKAAAWRAATLGRRVYAQRGGEALRRRGWTSKVPRPRQTKADPLAHAACKKPSRP
jgi:hypothetical protein